MECFLQKIDNIFNILRYQLYQFNNLIISSLDN
jgi:hypothetical protein